MDLKPYNGVSYYRLKQTDFNGDFSYSHIEQITFYNANAKIYPNPVNDLLTIEYEKAEYDLEILNVLGQTVYINTQYKNEANIDVSSFSDGMYQILIDKRFSKSFIKQ